ncbi:MAG: hypothetical protein WJU30_00251 [Candidatus Phytoplasma pruni]
MISSGIISFFVKHPTIKTGKKPFKKSKIKVSRPNLKPNTLVTFEEPIFFEPKALMSLFLKIFPTNKPTGIEPIV